MEKRIVALFLLMLMVLAFPVYGAVHSTGNGDEDPTPSSILDEELPGLSETTILIDKYYVEFDDAATYTIWLYTEESPSRDQINGFLTVLAVQLSDNFPNKFFNFEIFPVSSTKIPGDTQVYDSYANVAWRNNEAVFPVDFVDSTDDTSDGNNTTIEGNDSTVGVDDPSPNDSSDDTASSSLI